MTEYFLLKLAYIFFLSIYRNMKTIIDFDSLTLYFFILTQRLMSVQHSQIFVIIMQHAATQMEVILVPVTLDIQEMV